MINVEIEKIILLSKKPEIFTLGDGFIWDDEHISKQMLNVHLDSNTDRASYKPKTINRIVEFITNAYLLLNQEYKILDTGCGPGLYCERFAKEGFSVTGMDISKNSLVYAKESAKNKGLDINYIHNNYLDMNFNDIFDVVFIISHDFCVLSKEDRKKYLNNVYKALKPGGYFIFDTATPNSENETNENSKWEANVNGFWSQNPHLTLERNFYYEEEATSLYQCVVATEDDAKTYRIYHTYYTKESIKELLELNRFKVIDIYEDLTGSKYSKESKTLGIIAKKI